MFKAIQRTFRSVVFTLLSVIVVMYVLLGSSFSFSSETAKDKSKGLLEKSCGIIIGAKKVYNAVTY